MDKILRDKLKTRREAGERNIKIKDGKILTFTEEGAVGLGL